MSFDQINTPLQINWTVLLFLEDWSDLFVVGGAVVFCETISPVFISRCPVDLTLALFYSIFQPVKSHVDCFASLLFHCAIDNAICSGVISFNRSRWLWVTEFL